MNYEAVIGLEVHVQLKTASKMFTRVAAGYGEPANTLTDPVVLALPGALPVLNKAALDQIIKTGLMLGCTIAPVCKWDRKNYFYPDSPKNYQISQYDQPICLGGSVRIELPGSSPDVMGPQRNVHLTRIHLEEDVGKLNHGVGESLVDYNRAGTPLMEIVSEPVLSSAGEAYAFLTSLQISLIQANISDCDMEKGQMRCDANISIRPVGESKLGTKVELKNLNSILFVRDGIAHEIRRQIAVVGNGGVITQETRDFDGQTGTSQSLRSKEMAHDYRYFPDPDLMPVKVDETWKASIREKIPEHHLDRQRRYMDEPYCLSYSHASALVVEIERYSAFELECAELNKTESDLENRKKGYRIFAIQITNEYARAKAVHGRPKYFPEPSDPTAPEHIKKFLEPSDVPFLINQKVVSPILLSNSGNDTNVSAQSGTLASPQIAFPTGMAPGAMAAFAPFIYTNVVSASGAKTIYDFMYQTGISPEHAIEITGLRQSTDTGELEKWVADAIAANPKAVAEFKAGKEQAINAVKGAVMKASKGKANPKLVDEIVRKQVGG